MTWKVPPTTYDLNLSPGGVPLIIPISQYDAASRILVFNLYSSDGVVSLASGAVAEVRGTKPDELATGNGSLRIIANGSQKAMLDIAQGDVTADLAPHLNQGANSVSLTVTDVYGNSRTIRLTVTVVVIAISSTFDASIPYTGSIIFPYTPTGAVRKTIHFILDGVEIGSTETSVSGRQQSFTILQQSHGAHTLRVYFDAVINGETVRSNELFYELICLEPLDMTPIITSTFQQESVKQYGTLNIPYTVYNPASLFADVEVLVNGEQKATMLYESGVDPLIAMKIVGHTDYQTTANIYTHVRDEMLKKATVNMNEVFQNRTGKE